jgi:uncharacterized protein (DUF362 family)/NAD-dependent dihydropyrimidine dehydrogenase PreA subunit
METNKKKSMVAIIKCYSYNLKEVTDSIMKGIELLGGIRKFFLQNKKILIKPNVLVASLPEKCIMTHPSIFEATCICLKEAECKIFYGDSPALYCEWGKCKNAMKKAGFTEIAEKYGAEVADFDNGISVTHSNSKYHKKFVLAKGVLEADGIVSLPKLKTHGLTTITGAIKNQYGCVPGVYKGQYHAQAPDIKEFSMLLAEITSYIKPKLYIMDAIMAMEGNGPQNGNPKKLNTILISEDPVALDTIACRLINLDPSYVPTISAGEEEGLGTANFEQIECVGDKLEDLICPHFKVRREPVIKIPKNIFIKSIRNAFVQRPVIDSSICNRCGTCINACPVNPKAIGWTKAGRVKPPVYNYNNCIRCFCCHEMCPRGAIKIKNPFLSRLFPIASYLALLLSNVIVIFKKKDK